MGEVITFISGAGGQGKTGLLANIAAGLADRKKNILAIDICYGMRQLDLALGMENLVIYHLGDLIDGRCATASAVVRGRGNDNLSFLAAPYTKDISALELEKFVSLISELKKQYDFILIDCPSGAGHGLEVGLACADRVMAVLTPDPSGVRGLDKIVSSLDIKYKDNIWLIVNKIHPAYLKAGVQLNIDEISDILPQPIIGVIPFSPELHIRLAKGEFPVRGGDKASVLYSDLCQRIMGENIPFKNWQKYVKHKLK